MSSFDVRPAVKEQVESLGASFLELGVRTEETAGGYATELTAEQQALQQAALEERIPEFDVVSRRSRPGRPAPKLIPTTAVDKMRPGSVIVDLAAESGGNCELTVPGEIVEHGVAIVGTTNLASLMAYHASQLYSRNVAALLQHLAPEGELVLDWEDEITAGACVAAGERSLMDVPLVIELTILVLAAFLGFEVIAKVPTMLHTPLMSGANFIHGIVIVGAIIVLGGAEDGFTKAVGFAALVLATANVVGGWFVTDRMLGMFKRRPEPRTRTRDLGPGRRRAALPRHDRLLHRRAQVLSSPKHARKGNWVGGAGMLVAIATTLLLDGIELVADGQGLVIGSVVGVVGARTVRMTAMPQMVAIFNGVGGGAAALVALAEWHNAVELGSDETVSIVLSALIGSISFAGSVVAFAKLQELVSGRPIVFPGQNVVNAVVLLGAAALGIAAIAGVEDSGSCTASSGSRSSSA